MQKASEPEILLQPRIRLGLKVVLIQTLILSVAILLPAYLNIQNQRTETLRHLQDQLQTAANAISLSVSPEAFRTLNAQPSDTLLTEYQQLRNQLVSFSKANHYLGFDDDNVYLFKRITKDTLKFSVMVYNQFVGSPYLARPEMMYVFDKGSSSYTDIYQDENGIWVSAYAPILDSTNTVLGMVEADFKNNYYLVQLNQKLRNTIIVSITAIFGGAILSFLLTLIIVRPIRQITNAVIAFSKGKRDEHVENKSNDEIGILAAAFNFMTKEISERDRLSEEIRKQRLEETIVALNDSNAELERKQHELEVSLEELNKSNARIKSQQLQLVQAEKMSSLGQMVAGIAHEINTPLGFVKNSITLLSRNQEELEQVLEKQHQLAQSLIDGDSEKVEACIAEAFEARKTLEENEVLEDIHKMLGHTKNGVERIQELVINLKNFSRLDESAFKLVDINEGIESTLVIANNTIKHKAEVVKDLTPHFMVECFPSQLNQVLLNLIVNASQAIEGKGLINIVTRFESEVGKESESESDRHIALIKITDNGKGIPQENLSKIFDPFYTTKPIGQGTGLGLSISYQIIEKHSGSIKVQSQVGKGTEFSIRIPVRQSKN